ncbi:hypothetical protein P4N68_01500 [Corynebacterium felinum]|uniref:Uncharacterized protein n=1 Tax=Corynebacterium felinum TaxID=131318 RepID=A0ABU2BAH1_9CORY|nr:hypothetical protein [Corynebacterium felinum]MDF5819755.1 hypothetical protein [Corynebacterium felinum]MDR7354379.1 hypothetical protein [Corynebacterium felinum]WJY93750.1 hypothetical protein CFELI_00465 [Corynebacterium felinum]
MDDSRSSHTLAPALVDYHPDAPRPPFIWTAQLPTTWRFIETHPSRWKIAATRLADDYLPGVRLRSADKRAVLRQIEETVAQAQKTGVLMALVLPGIVEEELSAAVLLLRWIDSHPAPASIVAAQRELAQKNPQIERTGAGDSYVLVSHTLPTGPLTQRRTAYNHQAFYPIPNTTWTLVVSGSAPNEQLGELVADCVRRVITSVRAHPDTEGEQLIPELFGENSPPPTPSHDSEAEKEEEMRSIQATHTGAYQQ